MKDSLLILSGGMDSTTLLHHKRDDIALAICFNYGANHNIKEFKQAQVNCDMLKIPLLWIDMREAFKHSKSTLLQGATFVPEGHYAADNMAQTVVPFRNGILLSVAAGIAQSHNLSTVMMANHFGDDAQYPDCRQNFVSTFSEAINLGTGGKVSLYAPYTVMTKKDIARIGTSVGVDYSKTWSCYKGEDIHCGKCGTCVERIWALKEFNDPTMYEDKEFAINVLKEKGEW